MTWVFIIIAILLLLLFVPINLDIFYNGEFCVSVRVLFFKYVFSHKEKTNKKKSESSVKTDGESFSTKLSNFLDTLKTVKAIALRSISIKLFKVHIVVCSDDPCDTALLFGSINALCHLVYDLFLSFTEIKKTDVNITADYNGQKTKVLFNIVIRTYLFKFFISLIKSYADGTITSKDN